MLKELEISGFKSFAKKATLKFSAPISAIVGPNGSGKSNVAEAFRFALGEQSVKSMRGKRGEDLIFTGSDGSRVNRASVKLVFDNTARKLALDFDEVTIERVAHRDNSNEYFLNGSAVRLKDIVELLAGAHIGSSGHHIISQGEADRILSSNIHERRQMIEDALGLRVYQYKKLESQKKLEKTLLNMKEIESLRREIAPHLKFLAKQVEKIHKTEELRQEFRSRMKEYLKREDVYIAQSLARSAEDLKDPQHRETELLKSLEHARAQLEHLEKRDVKSEELIAVEKELHDLRFKHDMVTREAGKLEGEIEALKRGIERERERARHDDTRTVRMVDVRTAVKSVTHAIEKALTVRTLEAFEEALNRVQNIVVTFVDEHSDTIDTSRITDAEREVDSYMKKRSELEAHTREIKERQITAEARYRDVQQAIEKEKDSNREAEKNVFKYMAELNEVRTILATLKARERQIHQEKELFTLELKEAHVLGGREAVDYQSIDIDNALIMNEPRNVQEDRKKSLERLKIRLEDAGVGGASEILKEHKDTEERDAFLLREITDLEKARVSLEQIIADLDARLNLEFTDGLLKINAQFQHFFTMMFGGGAASLTLVHDTRRTKSSLKDLLGNGIEGMDGRGIIQGDSAVESNDTEDSRSPQGIDISVSLPRKKIKGLMMLSGGERALTSIALLFALSQVNPPPFIILDETDAALDEANSRKYGDMVLSLSELSQLIVITHNRETMSRAGILYGVTMGNDGGSKLLSIQFDEAVRVAK